MEKIRSMSFRLGVVAFVTGFALMVFELVAARILAPSVGSSTYVWTSVIGVIIAALSAGYYAGGRIADLRARASDVSWLNLIAAAMVAIVFVVYLPFLDWLAESVDDTRVQAVLASLILFAPASFILGTISPYLAKLNVDSLQNAGKSVANLSALNSIGGISGTFVAGFVLFGVIGSRETLLVVVVLLVVASWMLAIRSRRTARAIVSAAICLPFALFVQPIAGAVSIDTSSARYVVEDYFLEKEGRTVRLLRSGPGGAQSGVFTSGSNDLVFWYTRTIAAVVEQLPVPSRILVLGGGTFTLPDYFAREYPNTQIDVVEIDPELPQIAQEYFRYTPRDNINIISEDARTFVNRQHEAYDVVVVDVYNDVDVPFSLLTQEYARALAANLQSSGTVIVNTIAATDGLCARFFDAVDAPYSAEFSRGSYLPEAGFLNAKRRGNIILVYGNSANLVGGFAPIKLHQTTAYNDNFMPSDQLQEYCR